MFSATMLRRAPCCCCDPWYNPTMDQLLERIASKAVPEPMSGCYIWTAAIDKNGYGRVFVDGQNRRAHTVIYELSFGPVPHGHCVCHHCDTPSCVNPEHLFIGTHKDNMNDAAMKGRIINRFGRTKRRVSLPAPKPPRAKLTPAEVVAIRSAPNRRGIRNALAAEYNVSAQQIYRIRTGRRWAAI